MGLLAGPEHRVLSEPPLAALARQLDALRQRALAPTVTTGFPALDAVLPGGGLERGKVHEFLGVHRAQPSTDWVPPLALLIDLARSAALASPATPGRVVWIGPTIWPYAASLACAGPPGQRLKLDRCLFVRAHRPADRLWAADLALRAHAAAVVIADGSGFDLAATRRLQLAAEAGSGGDGHHAPLCLLARPPHERRELSAAATRWAVSDLSPLPSSTTRRWTVELLRCKGLQPSAHAPRAWVLERDHATRALRVAPDLLDRPGEAPAGEAAVRRTG